MEAVEKVIFQLSGKKKNVRRLHNNTCGESDFERSCIYNFFF